MAHCDERVLTETNIYGMRYSHEFNPDRWLDVVASETKAVQIDVDLNLKGGLERCIWIDSDILNGQNDIYTSTDQ